MSIFEAGMLICFGAAWPFSIYRSYTSKKNAGKSLAFLIIVLLGYVSGLIHKFLYNFDAVSYLYMLNAAMVAIDIGIFIRNVLLERSQRL